MLREVCLTVRHSLSNTHWAGRELAGRRGQRQNITVQFHKKTWGTKKKAYKKTVCVFVFQGLNKYLVHSGIVQEGEQWLAVRGGGGLVVHHSYPYPLWVSTDAQTDQRDLDDGQQKLETQRAVERRGEGLWCCHLSLVMISAINYKMLVLHMIKEPHTPAFSSSAPMFWSSEQQCFSTSAERVWLVPSNPLNIQEQQTQLTDKTNI